MILSRRKFLRAVAAISSSAALLKIITGCGSDTRQNVGPTLIVIERGTTTVTGMFYVNSQSALVDLHNAPQVPVNTTLEIKFSAAMDTNGSMSLRLLDNNGIPVAAGLTWSDSSTAVITPTTNLQPAMQYTLQFISGTDSTGKLTAQGDSATFTTA